LYRLPSGDRNERYYRDPPEMGTPEVERIPPMASGGSGNSGGNRSLVLAWDVSADQEEPWRRFLQELSASRYEQYAQSRRRLGILTESVWLAPKPFGEGVAIVNLKAEDPEWVLGKLLAASDAPFDSWYGTQMRKLFGFDLARSERVAEGELLFAWRDDDVSGELGKCEEDGNESR
jgi:hypothetical protein